MDDLSFGALEQPGKSASAGCAVCGGSPAGSVQIAAMRKSGGKPRALKTQSRTFCERHTVGLYLALERVWEEFVQNESEGVSGGGEH